MKSRFLRCGAPQESNQALELPLVDEKEEVHPAKIGRIFPAPRRGAKTFFGG